MMIKKRHHFEGEILKMNVGSYYLPEDKPKKPLGEDAHFICSDQQVIGVADGVGGWYEKGIDAGEYARQLMNNAVIAVHSEKSIIDSPKKVLKAAYMKTKAKGVSTACILTLKESFLNAVVMGDSGFMLFRQNKLLYRSPVMQHRFNCPYQLGSEGSCDDVDSAMSIDKIKVMVDDVVVVGTDGLFDNMYPTEIEEILVKYIAEPQELAMIIGEYALYNSFDQFFLSPFSKASNMAGIPRMGGKIDDITVLVARISPT